MQFSEEVIKIGEYARDEAMRTGWRGIFPDHLVLGMLRHGANGATGILASLGVSAEDMKARLDMAMMAPEPVPYSELEEIGFSEDSASAFNLAAMEAMKKGRDRIEAVDLLVGVCRCSGSIAAAYLASHGITASTLSSPEHGFLHDNPRSFTIPDPEETAAALEAQILSVLRIAGTENKKHFS